MKKRPTPAPGSPDTLPPRKGRLYRGLRTILIFLLLGAILNVAVAWGCMVVFDPIPILGFPHPSTRTTGFIQVDDKLWDIRRVQTSIFNYATVYVADESSEMPSSYIKLKSMHGTLTPCGDPSVFYPYGVLPFKAFESLGVGWPSYSLWLVYDPVLNRPTKSINLRGWAAKWSPYWKITKVSIPGALPLRVLPKYFILNTLFFALIIWLLFRSPVILRRRRRIRRGLCGQCGYVVSVNAGDPHASPNCTECGTPIPGIVRPEN